MVAPNSDSSKVSKVSSRKRAANRRNARQSTGPRSQAGKARSARNAVTHGIFARIVLDGENRTVFELMIREYMLALAPQNGVELDLVNRIVIAQWKIARCDDAEALHLDTIGARSRSIARDEVEKVKAEFGIEDIHDDSLIEDEDDRALFMRLRALERAATNYTMPACANLAAAMLERDNAIERMSRYQQRLQQQVHRCFAELERFRGTPRSQWAELPPSPYLCSRGGRRIDDDDATECNQVQPGTTEGSNAQNEPTAGEPTASPAPAGTCDVPGGGGGQAAGAAPPCTAEPSSSSSADADAADADADADADLLRQVVQLHQDHLDDPPDQD
jgi:hypothetical protein